MHMLLEIQGDISKPKFFPSHFPEENCTWMSQKNSHLSLRKKASITRVRFV